MSEDKQRPRAKHIVNNRQRNQESKPEESKSQDVRSPHQPQNSKADTHGKESEESDSSHENINSQSNKLECQSRQSGTTYKHCIVEGCKKPKAICSRFNKHVEKHHPSQKAWAHCQAKGKHGYKCPNFKSCTPVSGAEVLDSSDEESSMTLKRTHSQAFKREQMKAQRCKYYKDCAYRKACEAHLARLGEAIARAEEAELVVSEFVDMNRQETEEAVARLEETLKVEKMGTDIDIGQRVEALTAATNAKLSELAGNQQCFVIDCKENVMDRMSKFVSVKDKFLLDVRAIITDVTQRMELFGAKPTNEQSAIATATAMMCIVSNTVGQKRITDERCRRLLIEVPSAGGKSRITIQMVLTLLQECKSTQLKVVIVYPNNVLMLQDKEQFDQVQQLIKPVEGSDDYKQVQLLRFGSLTEAIPSLDKDTILVMDEVDYILIDQQHNDIDNAVVVKDLEFGSLVGLTATVPYKANMYAMRYFESMKFHRMVPSNEQLISLVHPGPTVTTWKRYWNQRKHKNLIVFTTDQDSTDILEEVAVGYDYSVILQDCEEKDIYQKMDKTCLLVTREDLMRGTDFRIADARREKGDGIDLIIAAPFSNYRTLQQACGRVGRCMENCNRFILAGVKEVDDGMDRKLSQTIVKLTQRL